MTLVFKTSLIFYESQSIILFFLSFPSRKKRKDTKKDTLCVSSPIQVKLKRYYLIFELFFL